MRFKPSLRNLNILLFFFFLLDFIKISRPPLPLGILKWVHDHLLWRNEGGDPILPCVSLFLFPRVERDRHLICHVHVRQLVCTQNTHTTRTFSVFSLTRSQVHDFPIHASKEEERRSYRCLNAGDPTLLLILNWPCTYALKSRADKL